MNELKYEIVGNTFQKTTVTKKNQILSSEIKKEGLYPVIDQGQDYIAGYCDDETKLVKNDLPYIIFGDHTRAIKYVDFPFIIGADGTQVLKPKIEFDPKYYYFALLFLNIPSRGYNRHFSILKEKQIPLPPLPTQRKIAHILSKVQEAIAQQTALIDRTIELKKAMMHKLFTEGTKGEKQKITEIGLVPESWDVVELGSLLSNTQMVNIKQDGKKIIKYVDVSSVSRNTLKIVSYEEYSLNEAPGRARKKMNSGDVIFATVRPTLLRVALIDNNFNDQICSTAFCVLRSKYSHSQKYIYYAVQREKFVKQLASIQSGASYPAVTDKQVKQQLFPLPKNTAEQIAIAGVLQSLDIKIEQCRIKKLKLSDLFESLMKQLMYGATYIEEVKIQSQIGVIYDY